MERFQESIRELLVETSTNLPPDVRRALRAVLAAEVPGSQAALALHAIALNVDLATARCGPICQDTGMPTFEVKCPVGADQLKMSADIAAAIEEATAAGKLRPNSVDSLTGTNSGTNLGPGTPVAHFEQWLSDDVEVRLILKGGGSENVGAQYSLPCELPHLGRANGPTATSRACASARCTRFTRRRARAAASASPAWRSAATAARDWRSRSSSCFGAWTTKTRTPRCGSSSRRSCARATPSASARWASAATSR